MANLTANFPAQQVGNDLYNALDFYGWDQRNRQFESAMRNEQMSRDAALQDYLFKQQENPLSLKRKEIDNANESAKLPGIQGEAQSKAVAGRIAGATEQDALKAERAKYAQTISDADLKDAENQIHLFRMGAKTPQEKKVAEALWAEIANVKLEREKLTSQQKIAAGHDATSVQVANIGAASREKVASSKGASGKSSRDFVGSLDKMKKAHEKHAALVMEAKSLQESNPELADIYMSMAEALRPQAEMELRMLAKPGSVDVSATTGGKVVTHGQGSIAPNNPLAASPNPGPVADRRVRVVSPDGKVGTIPASQLQQAMKQGYKQQ